MSRTVSRSPAQADKAGRAGKGAHRVSHPHDAAERQADKAADVVARGGSVSGWSFAGVPTSAEATVHREETAAPKSEDEKKKEALTKAAEAALETETGKRLKEKVLDDPLVKKVKAAATSPAGIAVGLGLAAGGVGALAATGKELPFQPPEIPLDKITPGLSAKVTYEGPVNAPTKVGLTLTYKEQGPATPKGPDERERFRAETARIAADQEAFRRGLRFAPGSKAAAEQADRERAEQEAIARFVASRSALPGVGRPLIPLTGGPVVTTAPPTEAETKAPPESTEEKKKDDAAVQREPATQTAEREAAGAGHGADLDARGVDAAVASSGRPLEPSLRRSMEARFGYDFSGVRVHDDPTAAAAAGALRANAFTLGEDIAFAPGTYDPSTPQGRHLLAHELAHVVQQAHSGAGPVLHRRGVFESIGILLGLEEGTWSDQELHAYLDGITASGRIDGAYDADNKARAIVRRWQAASPGFDLLAPQKALLIKEMLDGPTLGEDETCILDLLENSDAGDLRAIFSTGGVRLADLESDVNGDNRVRLDGFVARRFRGGAAALRAGTVEVLGDPIPAGAPAFSPSAATLDAWLDSDRSTAEVFALLDRFSPADLTTALAHLSAERHARERVAVVTLAAQASGGGADAALRRQLALANAALARTEAVLRRYFHVQARAGVQAWLAASPGVDLLAPAKIGLVRDLVAVPSIAEDGAALLDLLEASDAGDLRAIFGGGGVPLAQMDATLHPSVHDRFEAFLAARFRGGRAALAAGTIEVIGDPVPAGAPRYPFDTTTFDARVDSDRTTEELVALVERFSDADRERALHHLSQVRRPALLTRLNQITEQFEAETDQGRRDALRVQGRAVRASMLKVERVLLHFYRDRVPATEADLRAGTSATAPARQAELREALRPPRRAAGAATFQPTLPGEAQTYEEKLRAHLPAMIQEYFDHIVGNRDVAAHSDPARVHTLAEFEAIGNVSKARTDQVFGRFYSAAAHPPMRADRPGRRGNIHDAFADFRRRASRMTPGQRRETAKALLFYFFQSDSWVRRLNHAHDAAPRFDDAGRPQNDEARSLDRLATEFTSTADQVRRLNEIDRNWPASAQGGHIFIQLFRAATPEADRLLLWDMFQTLIHEYVHTLEHDDYHAYATSFGDNSNEYNTLVEGVCSLLTEVVWTDIEAIAMTDHALRESVEGTANAALPPIEVPHASQRRYPSYTEALRLVDLVGIQNLYAAFFLGLADRIGGPPPPARRRP